MGKLVSDGLSRLQNQSRIPASTWRQWCNLLKLDPIDAVDVWEEVCHPIMLATRQVPEVPYILQMRAARLELDIFDFREEVPKILHLVAFLYSLKDGRLTNGKVKSALLKFYRKASLNSPPGVRQGAFVEQFIMDVCAAILVAKILPAATINLAGVVKPIIEGRGSIDQILQLGLKALGDKPYADVVRECLDERKMYAERAASAVDDGDSGDEENYDDGEEDDGDSYNDDDDYGDEEEEDDYGDEEDDDDEAGDDDDDDDDYGNGEDDSEDDDEEDDYGGDGGALDSFLVKFKTSLHKMYEYETEVVSAIEEDEDSIDRIEALLDERLKAIVLFKPMQATIPSVEEAQVLARRAEASRNPTRVHKPAVSAPAPAAGGGGAVSGGGGSLTSADKAAMIVKSEGNSAEKLAPQAGKPAARGQAGFIETDSVADSVDVAPSDMVEPEEVNLPELGEKVQEIGKLLAAVEPHEQQVWALVIEPSAEIADKRGLARTLGTEGTGADKAYNNIKQVARYLKIKNLLNVPQQQVRKDRNFMTEVRGFINQVRNNRKLDSSSRQLAPLARILDHAAAALVRLEALRTNYNFSNDYPEQYTREAVTLYYEEALRTLTDLADAEIRGQARQKADGDTGVLLAMFRAEQFADNLVKTTCAFMSRLQADGRTKLQDDFKAACTEDPIEFEGVEEGEKLGEVPADLLVSENMGEVFDEACLYALTEAWQVMQPIHQPELVAARLKEGLRQVLVGSFIVTPEMKRHQERSAFALAVVGLDKLTGNINLKEYFVRVSDDGQVAYVDGYESGDYADLFELREYKPSRVHAAAKKQKEDEGTEELQTGRTYLFTVGRTRKLFGDTPSELLNGCVRAEGGGPKVFSIF